MPDQKKRVAMRAVNEVRERQPCLRRSFMKKVRPGGRVDRGIVMIRVGIVQWHASPVAGNTTQTSHRERGEGHFARGANRRRESATSSFARNRLDFNDFAFDDFAARLRLAAHPCAQPGCLWSMRACGMKR